MKTKHFRIHAILAALCAAVPAFAGFSPLSIAVKGAYNGSDDQLPGKYNTVAGFRIALFSGGHDGMFGLAVSAGANFDDGASGFQIAAAGRNEAESAPFGLFQLSVVGNRLGGDGGVVQISIRNEIDGTAEGFQLGVANEVDGGFSGVQIGGLNRSKGEFSGLQLGVSNSSDGDFHGVQIGVVNQAKGTFRGVQIGAVNQISGAASGIGVMQLGPFNAADGKDWDAVFVPLVRIAF